MAKIYRGKYEGDNLRILTSDGKTLALLDSGQYERKGIVPILYGVRGKLGRPRFVKRKEKDIYDDAMRRGADVLVEFNGRRIYTAGLARITLSMTGRGRLGLPQRM